MLFTEITDDLTGAVDSGSYFTGRGQRLHIFTSGMEVPPRLNGEIQSFNLSSRNTEPSLARKLHYDLMSKIKKTQGEVFMKKIGTGFRGNDPYELEGLLQARPEYNVFIIDNAPELGTFTLYGNQYCEGEILHKSLYAKDPINPPKESFIPHIISSGTSLPVGLIDIDTVKCGDIMKQTQELLNDGKKIIVFDAITDKDTLHIIASLAPVFTNVFWTGSLGIANGLAEYFYGPRSAVYHPSPRNIRSLCFCASDYDIAHKQIEYSRQYGLGVVAVDVDSYINGDSCVLCDAVQKASDALKFCNVMIVPRIDKYSHKQGASVKILECISETAYNLCNGSVYFDRLVVVGGETAQSIFRKLGVGALDLGLAIEPGVAEGVICDGVLSGTEFAMKGGSMGGIDALEKMMCRGDDNNVQYL